MAASIAVRACPGDRRRAPGRSRGRWSCVGPCLRVFDSLARHADPLGGAPPRPFLAGKDSPAERACQSRARVRDGAVVAAIARVHASWYPKVGGTSHERPSRRPHTDREPRRHRRSRDRRAGVDRRRHRLHVRAVVRLALGLRGAARSRARRHLPGRRRCSTTSSHKQLYLPDTNVLLTRFLSQRRRRRGVGLHAGRGGRPRAQRRAPRQDGARRGALPDALRAALRLRARRAHGRADRRRGAVRRRRRASRSRCGCARRCRCGSKTATRSPSSRCAPTSRRAFVLEEIRPGEETPCGRPGLRVRGVQGDGQLLAPLDRPVDLSRALARGGRPLGADAQAADLARRTARSSPRRRSACPSGSAAAATGTTATRGSATPRSRSTASCASASPRKPARSCAGSRRAAASSPPDGSLQIMYGIDGRDGAGRGGAAAPRGLPGLAAGAHRQRRRACSSSSTSTAS